MDPWGQGLKGCHSRSAGSALPMSWSNNLEQYQWAIFKETGWKIARKKLKVRHEKAAFRRLQ